MPGIQSRGNFSVTWKLREREGNLGISYIFGGIARHRPQQDHQGRVYIKKRRRFRTNPWGICSYSLAMEGHPGEDSEKD